MQGGEPPRQGERPCGAARATPEVGAQGALGRKGDMNAREVHGQGRDTAKGMVAIGRATLLTRHRQPCAARLAGAHRTLHHTV